MNITRTSFGGLSSKEPRYLKIAGHLRGFSELADSKKIEVLTKLQTSYLAPPKKIRHFRKAGVVTTLLPSFLDQTASQPLLEKILDIFKMMAHSPHGRQALIEQKGVAILSKISEEYTGPSSVKIAARSVLLILDFHIYSPARPFKQTFFDMFRSKPPRRDFSRCPQGEHRLIIK